LKKSKEKNQNFFFEIKKIQKIRNKFRFIFKK